MNEHVRFVYEKRLERVKKALEKRHIKAYVVQTAAEVPAAVAGLVPKGCTVSSGGSATLVESGVVELLRNGDYTYLDREAEGADRLAIQRAAFSADAYLASANAITEQGEIFEMDGRGNRVAAIAHGPASVVLVVGRNKVVEDLDAARRRNATMAAPANVHRVGVDTPCAVTGICGDCQSPQRICCDELVIRGQMDADRIKVILVNEDLGF